MTALHARVPFGFNPQVQPRDRLIVALDVSTAAAAREVVAKIGDSVRIYKIGMQLFTAEGPAIVRELVSADKRVFLDLKYHDIPNTVSGAVKEAAKLGVSMLTVHAAGGEKMLQAAVDSARTNPDLIVLAVTVLTSLGDSDLNQIGMQGKTEESVLRLAEMALRSGCHGVVASAREAAPLRSKLGRDFVIVTPGVRLSESAAGDQVRVATPAAAIAAGSDYVVVGRPITEASDPAAQAKTVIEQISL